MGWEMKRDIFYWIIIASLLFSSARLIISNRSLINSFYKVKNAYDVLEKVHKDLQDNYPKSWISQEDYNQNMQDLIDFYEKIIEAERR